MATDLLEPRDLADFNDSITERKAASLIKYVTADAKRIAPCIATITDSDQLDAVRAILIRAALRWHDSGSGALQQWNNTDGPFSRGATIDTRGPTTYSIFYPSEKADLQALCVGPGSRKRAARKWLL